MPQESLRELLARVHERLSTIGGALDAESRQLLGTVMRDIERLDPGAAGAAAHARRGCALSRWSRSSSSS